MDSWQSAFAKKVGQMESSAAGRFEQLADAVIEPAACALASMLGDDARQAFRIHREPDVRQFLFSRSAGAHLVVRFRRVAMNQLECDSDGCISGLDHLAGVRSSISLMHADWPWIESCLHQAMDRFSQCWLIAGTRAVEEARLLAVGNGPTSPIAPAA
jgi:hypothetical protein